MSTTNIMDLPAAPTLDTQQPYVQQPLQQQQAIPQQQPPALDPATATELLQSIAMASQQGATDLPSRDIPIQTQHLIQDPQITPHYIPPASNRDYIDEEEETNEYMIEQAQRKDVRNKQMDALYTELHMPLLVALLFFLFQLPFFNKLLFRYIPRLFSEEGQKNIYGYFFVSALFGLLYYMLDKGQRLLG
jgi:hypothetical protein